MGGELNRGGEGDVVVMMLDVDIDGGPDKPSGITIMSSSFEAVRMFRDRGLVDYSFSALPWHRSTWSEQSEPARGSVIQRNGPGVGGSLLLAVFRVPVCRATRSGNGSVACSAGWLGNAERPWGLVYGQTKDGMTNPMLI